MRNWVIGGCVVAIVVVAAVVFTPPKPAPVTQVPGDYSIRIEPNPPKSPPTTEPTVLAEVVNVTDIDPLLDPPAIPQADSEPLVPMLTAVGYEIPAPRPVEPTEPVVPIPPAAEEPEERSIAPMPRLVGSSAGSEAPEARWRMSATPRSS